MRKGFTLIELLAVIAILAIISLITVPIALNTVNNAQDKSNEISLKKYASSVKNAIKQYELKNGVSPIGNFITSDGKMLIGDSVLEISYGGSEVICDEIEIYWDESFYLNECTINKSSKKYTYGKDKSYDNGQIVYFDVSKGVSCSEEEYKLSYDETTQDYLNSKTGYNGINGTVSQNSCLKFYAFNDDFGDKINLILDHNTTATKEWINRDDFADDYKWGNMIYNSQGPLTLLKQLKIDTNEWVGTIIPADYEYKGTARPYTINYSEYKARLITAQEIAKITGADKLLSWDETTSSAWYYLDGAKSTDSTWQTQVANSTTKSDYYWLFDRTYNCISYGCQVADSSNYGYWTSTASARSSSVAWSMFNNGYVQKIYNAYNSGDYGVRPVIEVLKSKL